MVKWRWLRRLRIFIAHFQLLFCAHSERTKKMRSTTTQSKLKSTGRSGRCKDVLARVSKQNFSFNIFSLHLNALQLSESVLKSLITDLAFFENRWCDVLINATLQSCWEKILFLVIGNSHQRCDRWPTFAGWRNFFSFQARKKITTEPAWSLQAQKIVRSSRCQCESLKHPKIREKNSQPSIESNVDFFLNAINSYSARSAKAKNYVLQNHHHHHHHQQQWWGAHAKPFVARLKRERK